MIGLEPEESRVNDSLNPIVRKEIQTQVREISLWVYNNLDYGDSLSVFFAGEIQSRST